MTDTTHTVAEKLALIATLRDDYDHVFLSREGVLHFTTPFGFEGKTFVMHAEPDHPKGLTLANGVASAEGCPAESVAAQIAAHLGLKVPGMMGRGFALRANCAAIERYLKSL